MINLIKKLFEKREECKREALMTEAYEENKARNIAGTMETTLGHLGLPKNVIYNLEILESHCKKISNPYIKTKEGDLIHVRARLGRLAYNLSYNNKGYFDGLETGFTVKGLTNPLF